MTNDLSNEETTLKFPTREEQERQNLLFQARNTTPLQRLQWLEETLELVGPHITTSSTPQSD